MKTGKKIRIFAIMLALLCVLSTVSVFAAVNPDKDINSGDLSLPERLKYALEGTVTGMVMVFMVLGLLYAIVSLSKAIFYDMPRKRAESESGTEPAPVQNNAPVAVSESTAQPAPDATMSDGELAAVITAAIAAMIESGDYKNEFVGGFRVVSFKRSTQGAWNRK